MTSALYVGLMSGTSQDAVDATVVEFAGTRFRRVVSTHTVAYAAPLRQRLLALARDLRPLSLHDLCELDQAVATTFARAALGALRKKGLGARRIVAIGSHGQTVFHATKGRVRSSVQLGDPNVIAAMTGITTVADFRRKDVALGGEGAPLVPAFHHALFADAKEPRVVVNLGGIANLTLLPNARQDRVTGFDTGPGNALLDEWIQEQRGKDFDDGGDWAASGERHEELLKALLSDPYFRRKPPKSTGRDYFNLGWVRRRYPALDTLRAEDVQHSLVELTVLSISRAVEQFAPKTRRVLVCGGGVKNRFLVQRIRMRLSPRAVQPTGARGLDSRWVEAVAFAWLAMRTLNGLPGNLPAVTGAKREAVLGGIYRA